MYIFFKCSFGAVGCVSRYTGTIFSVNTPPKPSVTFGTAAISYRTLRSVWFGPNLTPVPDDSVSSGGPPKVGTGTATGMIFPSKFNFDTPK